MITRGYKKHLILNLRRLPLLEKTKEEVTLAKIVDPILELAGFETINLQSVEEELDAQTGDSCHPIEIDRCLKNNGKPMAFVQCKQIGSRHRLRNDHEKTFKAAKIGQIRWVVFTDGEYWDFHKLGKLNYKLNDSISLRYDQVGYQKVVNILRNLRKETYE